MDPYVYQYAIGGVVFVIGMAYAVRQGYVGLSGRGLVNLALMFGGLAFFMALQGYLQYAPMTEAPRVAPTGGGASAPRGMVGKPVDYIVMLLYMAAILAIGLGFGKRNKSTKDFFFGGQRFAWWLIAASLVATLVGSYSFVKYSRAAYTFGLSSSQSYFNDWALMPLLLFGWLPILYFSRIVSVPEYFGRRFDSKVRLWATISVLRTRKNTSLIR